MSGFGPPPGEPVDRVDRGRPSYVPPGGSGFSGPGHPAYEAWLQGSTAHPLTAIAHRPGIISLRPMTIGELLDGAVKHFRRNPGPVLGLSLVVVSVSLLPSVLLSAMADAGSWYAALALDAVISSSELSVVLLLLGAGIATLLLVGVLAHSVAEATLGRRPGVGETSAVVRPRLGALVALQLTVTALFWGPVLILVLLLALASSGAVVAVTAGVGGIAVVGWWSLLLPRTMLAGPALVLERLGVRASLRRAWALSAGSFWRLAGTVLVVGGLALLVYLVIQLPLVLIGTLVTVLVDLSPSMDALAGAIVLNLATMLAACLVAPFIAAATTLAYVDQRMRKEGLDLVLVRAASSGSGAAR